MIHSTRRHTVKSVLHHFDCVLRIKIMRFEDHREFCCIYCTRGREYEGELELFGQIVLREYSYIILYLGSFLA